MDSLKKISSVVVILIIFLSIAFYTSLNSLAEVGTNCSNSNNDLGKILEKGDWIYYTDMRNGGFYKVSIDAKRKIKLSSDNAEYINVCGNYIYYTDAHKNGIWSMSTNGKNKKKLLSGEVDNMIVVGNTIYYLREVTEKDDDTTSYIFKVRTDGSKNTTVIKSDNLIYVDNDSLYCSYENKNEYGYYKINLKTNKKTKLYEPRENEDIDHILIDGNYTYMQVKTEKPSKQDSSILDKTTNYLIICDTNGKQIRKFKLPKGSIKNLWSINKALYIRLNKMNLDSYEYYNINPSNGDLKKVINIFITGNKIHYCSIKKDKNILKAIGLGVLYFDGLSISNTDSIEKFKSVKYNSPKDSVGCSMNDSVNAQRYILEKNGWIYFCTITSNNNGSDSKPMFYKIKTDGTHKTLLEQAFAKNFNVAGDWIYYDLNNSIYKMKTDGSQKVKLADYLSSFMQVVGDYIYCADEYKDKIYKIRVDGAKSQVLTTSLSQITGMAVYGNKIYFSNFDGINEISIDGTNKHFISKRTENENYISDGLIINNNWIYSKVINEKNSSYSMLKMSLDGKQKKLIDFIGGITDKTNIAIINDWIYYISENKIRKMDLNGSNNSLVLNTYLISDHIHVFDKTNLDEASSLLKQINGQ